MQDSSFLTRDRILAPCSGSVDRQGSPKSHFLKWGEELEIGSGLSIRPFMKSSGKVGLTFGERRAYLQGHLTAGGRECGANSDSVSLEDLDGEMKRRRLRTGPISLVNKASCVYSH